MAKVRVVDVLVLSDGMKVSASYVEHLLKGIREGKQFHVQGVPVPNDCQWCKECWPLRRDGMHNVFTGGDREFAQMACLAGKK